MHTASLVPRHVVPGFTAGKAEARAAAAEELVEHLRAQQLKQGPCMRPYGNGSASSADVVERGADWSDHGDNADAGAIIIDIGTGIGPLGDI